jgi:hypothetical protein
MADLTQLLEELDRTVRERQQEKQALDTEIFARRQTKAELDAQLATLMRELAVKTPIFQDMVQKVNALRATMGWDQE